MGLGVGPLTTASADGDVAFTRIGLGIAGSAAGTLLGAVLGYERARNCPFDECALWNEIFGGAIGAVLGSAIVAGAPEIGSKCSAAARIAAGAGAALVAGVAGGFVGAAARGNSAIVGFLAGTSVGSGIGSSICR